MTTNEIGIDDMHEVPWSRSSWHGELVSLGGCPASDFTRDDIARVIAWGTTDKDDWDGSCAGLVLLKDDRYVAWESGWGPTGSGFCEDAYGGDADVIFARHADMALREISERCLGMLVFNMLAVEWPLASVLRDAWLEGKTFDVLREIAVADGGFTCAVEHRLRWLMRTWSKDWL